MSADVRAPVMTAEEWRAACLATAPPLTPSQIATLRAIFQPRMKTAPRPPRQRAARTQHTPEPGGASNDRGLYQPPAA